MAAGVQRDRAPAGVHTRRSEGAPLPSTKGSGGSCSLRSIWSRSWPRCCRRLLAYLLCHCGLGLKVQVVASAASLSPLSLVPPLRKIELAQLLRSLCCTHWAKPSCGPSTVAPGSVSPRPSPHLNPPAQASTCCPSSVQGVLGRRRAWTSGVLGCWLGSWPGARSVSQFSRLSDSEGVSSCRAQCHSLSTGIGSGLASRQIHQLDSLLLGTIPHGHHRVVVADVIPNDH